MTLSALHAALIREQTDPLAEKLDAQAKRIDAVTAVLLDISTQQRRILERLGEAPGPVTPPAPAPEPEPEPVPVPVPLPRPVRAVYVGNEPAAADAHDRWFGQTKTPVVLFTEQRDWVKSPGIGWWINRWEPTGRKIFWSIPLHPDNSRFEDTTAGKWDQYFDRIARQLAAAYPTGLIHIRLSWEFNGAWFPWTIHGGRHQHFIDAWRRVVRVMRAVDPRFRFDWCTNEGTSGADPELAYPGDDVVDIISQDIYWKAQWDGTDPDMAWKRKLTQPHGLNWLREFSTRHGKPMAIPEWGVSGNNAAPFIRSLADWIAANSVVYHGLWDENAAYDGMLRTDRWPGTSAAYKAAFGG
jgi:hypothetical protein